MNRVMKLTIVAAYITTAAFGSTELTSSQAYVAQRLGQLKVHHHNNDFYVEDDIAVRKVQRCFVDKPVRGITKEDLAKFLACGRVSVNRCGDDDFSIKAHPRLVGGGPVTGAALYWITKIGCYGTAAAATTTIATMTAGTGLAAAGGVASAAAGSAVAAGAGAGAPIAGLVGAGIANTAAVSGAATVTAGAVTGAGSIAGAVAAVETASTAAFMFGTAIPFLP